MTWYWVLDLFVSSTTYRCKWFRNLRWRPLRPQDRYLPRFPFVFRTPAKSKLNQKMSLISSDLIETDPGREFCYRLNDENQKEK